MTWALFLDDIRAIDYNPKFTQQAKEKDLDVNLARSSKEAKTLVREFGCPCLVSFDHDLGEEDTAIVFIKWLIEIDQDSNYQLIPENFSFMTHSSNPVGSMNIFGLIDSYLHFRLKYGTVK